MIVIETERLNLRQFTPADASFVVELLNDPGFLKYIGDRNVRTTDDALKYIAEGPQASYEKHGFGLWVVEVKETGTPAGMCGLLKRDVLEDIDVGYAFLPQYRSSGYALESVRAVQRYAFNILDVTRLAAVVNADNDRSIRLLEKIGMHYERMVRLKEDQPEIRLYVSEKTR